MGMKTSASTAPDARKLTPTHSLTLRGEGMGFNSVSPI